MRHARIRGRGPVQNSPRRPKNSPRTARSIETGEICGRGFFGRFWRCFRGRPHPVPSASSRGRTRDQRRTREGPEAGDRSRRPLPEDRNRGRGPEHSRNASRLHPVHGTAPHRTASGTGGPDTRAPHRRTGGNVAIIRRNGDKTEHAPRRPENGLLSVPPVQTILLSAALFSPVFALRSYAES